MTGTNTRSRPSRGRNKAAVGRAEQLPPIPERRLSGKGAIRSSGRGVAPPSPESRKSGASLPLHQKMVDAFESRDDEDVPSSPVALSLKRPEEITVSSALVAVSTPQKRAAVKNEPRASLQEPNVSSVAAASYSSRSVAATPLDSSTTLEFTAPGSSSAPIIDSEDRIISEEGVSGVSTSESKAQTAIQTIRDVSLVPSSVVRSSSKNKPSISPRSVKDAMSATTTEHKKLADAATPYTSNVTRKHIQAVVGTTNDNDAPAITESDTSSAIVMERSEDNKHLTKYTPEPSWEDFQRDRINEAKAGGDNSNGSSSANLDVSASDPPAIVSTPTDEIMDSFMKKPSGKKSRRDKYDHIADDYSNASDEEFGESTSRDTRDQYQLVRLQARINRRSGRGSGNKSSSMPSPSFNKDSPSNYKSLRSSRIKTARNLYHPAKDARKQQHSNNAQLLLQQVAAPIANEDRTGSRLTSGTRSNPGSIDRSQYSIANNTSSTIPSLQPGGSINPSLTSSAAHSGAHVTRSHGASYNSSSGARSTISGAMHSAAVQTQTSVSTPELSEYRGKLFAKMLHLLNDLSPTQETLQEEDVSNVKDIVIDEGRASCCSIAELKLIQKLTEEEMSRILHEFEQNNSLVERRDAAVFGRVPDVKMNRNGVGGNGILGGRGRSPASGAVQRGGDGHNRSLRRMTALEKDGSEEESDSYPMPEKIVYHDEGMADIASEFSDVTSPTCHDGFELDEILPGRVHNARAPIPSKPKTLGSPAGPRHKKRFPSTASLPPSLSAAAMAAAAAAATMSLSGMEHSLPQYLPSVMEMTDPNGFKEENEAAKTAKGRATEEDEVERNVSATEASRMSSVEGNGNNKTVKGRAAEEEEVGRNGSTTEASRMSSIEGDENNDVKKFFEEEAASDTRETTQSLKGSMYDDDETESCSENSSDVPTINREQAILAASRRLAAQMDKKNMSCDQALEKNHFDGILSAAAKAGGSFSTLDDPTATTTRRRGRLDQREELDEVTSILSQYEAEAEKKAEEKEANIIASVGVESKSTGAATSAADVVSGGVLVLDNMNDLSPIPKKVTILEPLPTVEHDPVYDNKPLCGICVIQ